MNVIVCLDEKQGMLFHMRRQSQDRVLREHILQICEESVLWMNAYSYKLYASMEERPVNIEVEEAFLQKAAGGEFCLVENVPLKPYESQIEMLIVFCWNKTYPADCHFNVNLDDGVWELEKETDFAGSSHPKITEKRYRRRPV